MHHNSLLTKQHMPLFTSSFLSVGKRKVLWHNMREEPLLYINGKPYVVRDAVKPFANLEYTGWIHLSAAVTFSAFGWPIDCINLV